VIYLFHRPFRDIFLKMGGYQYFLYTKKGGLEQASFFLLLLLISTILSFLLGRKSLYQICKKRW
jgi:possible acetyltransferase